MNWLISCKHGQDLATILLGLSIPTQKFFSTNILLSVQGNGKEKKPNIRKQKRNQILIKDLSNGADDEQCRSSIYIYARRDKH